jgi:hypothetical protein
VESITIAQILDYLQKFGLLAFFVLVGWTGMKRIWVWGYQAEELREDLADMTRERDAWRDLALSGTTLADKAVTALHRSTTGVAK